MRHNAEPGRHSATSSATAAMIDTRSQLNSKGTRTLALTAENGIREPTGSSIHRRTELPGFTLRYSERRRGDGGDLAGARIGVGAHEHVARRFDVAAFGRVRRLDAHV